MWQENANLFRMFGLWYIILREVGGTEDFLADNMSSHVQPSEIENSSKYIHKYKAIFR